MDLGAFSISLAVKDLEASRQFYEKFGFKAFPSVPRSMRRLPARYLV
jgi:lactoylglutathione lyase